MAGYGDDDGFTAYAAAAGYTVPSGTIAAARQRGSLYIDGTYGWRFPGTPAGGADQDRAWPRVGASDIYGNPFDPAAIPVAVVNASYEAAFIELTKPGSLSTIASASRNVTMLKAGSAQIEYAKPDSGSDLIADSTPMSTLIAGILYPIIGPNFTPGVLVV